MWDKVFLVFWDGEGVRPGGQMIPCSNREDVNVWGGGAVVGFPLGCTLGGRRRGQGRGGGGVCLSYLTISNIA